MRLPVPRLLHAWRTLRGRLTVWHSLILCLVLIAFSLSVYGLLARSLEREVDRSLAERAQQVNDTILPPLPQPSEESTLVAPPEEPTLVAPPHDVLIPPPVTFSSADTFVQVVDSEGRIFGSSDNLDDTVLPITADDLATMSTGQDRYAEAKVEGEEVRVYSAPLLAGGEAIGVVQVARSLEPYKQGLAQLRLLAGVGLLIALVLSGVVVWLTAGAALRPLERVIETAGAIGSSRDLDRRVDPPTSKDEVGRLARTFNLMLERLAVSDAELREAYAKLEETLEAQRRFVADASHELRTPLTTIRGNAALLRQVEDVTPEDRAAALAQIGDEAERMSRLVGDLLTLARADAGRSVTRKVPVPLGPLLEDVTDQARLLADGQHVRVEILRPVEVIGDPDALRQLALILLDNAVRYTPPGGRINARLDATDDEARLTVADTGIGIAKEDLPYIFDRFYRADKGRKAGGTGLGLAIARWIAEEHGGTIEAASAPGRGSVFVARLPVTGHVATDGNTTPPRSSKLLP